MPMARRLPPSLSTLPFPCPYAHGELSTLPLSGFLRIPTITTGDSDGSRPPVPIDRDHGRRGCCDAVGSSL